MEWFKHDSNAHMDAKLRKLRIKYGMEGYGLYWYCLELIAKDVKATNITFQLEHDSEIIAHDTGINYKLIEEMITYMVDLQLFECSHGVISCLKMAKRLDQSMTSNPKMREMISQIKDGHDGVMINHDSIMQEEKRIEKNRNREKRKRFVPPTVQEVSDYVTEKGYQIDPQAFVDHYESVNWYRGKTKITSWKSCVATWNNRKKLESSRCENEVPLWN